jgi:hypothetical protein
VVDIGEALKLRVAQVGDRRQQAAGASERAEVLELEFHLGRVPGLDRADEDLRSVVEAHALAGESSARGRRRCMEVERRGLCLAGRRASLLDVALQGVEL